MHQPPLFAPSRVLSCLLIATLATAQGAIVSPVGTALVEGMTGALNSGNVFPFVSNVQRRYMQIHGDLGGNPLVITQLSFRINSDPTNYTSTRTQDLELYMGEGLSALEPKFAFDANYVTPRTLVIPRTQLTFGPTGQGSATGPNPFTGNMDLVLSTPFIYSGAHPLVWETVMYGVTGGGQFASLDVEQGFVTASTSSVTGTGCNATGNTAAMTHTFTCNDIAGTLLMNATVAAAPANSLCFLGIGFSNPVLTVPGLCSTVYTDAVLTQLIGFSDAGGAITTARSSQSTFVLPNTLVGVPLYTQVFGIDAASSAGIPFTGSNGRVVTVPASNTTRVNQVSRLFNSVGGNSATEALCLPQTVGFSLVTRISHL